MTGFSGRVGLFEVLEVSKQIRKMIIEKADSEIIEKQAVEEGMLTMLNDGILKIIKGVTTIEEVLRVTRVSI